MPFQYGTREDCMSYQKTSHINALLSVGGLVIIFVFITGGSAFCSAKAGRPDQVLQLAPDQDRYFLGPHLDYLEDPSNRLSIADVTSPELSARFVRNKSRLVNLSRKPIAYWIRFTLLLPKESGKGNRWLLYFGWPKEFDRAKLYKPIGRLGQWQSTDVGRILPGGLDPMPSTPAEIGTAFFLSTPKVFYLQIFGPSPPLALQLVTEKAYQRMIWRQLILCGLYYGVMLAMILYNIMLFFILRELNRFIYVIYMFFMALVFFTRDGGLYLCFQINPDLSRLLIQIFISVAFVSGILFAKSFLITKKHAPFPDKLLTAFLAVSAALIFTSPFIEMSLYDNINNILFLVVPPTFIISAAVCLIHGFRPARFFLIAFFTVALGTVIGGFTYYGWLPYTGLTVYWAQIGSGLEVILLQLALADRINILRRERDRIKHSLHLASEVQQNLLPRVDPEIPGLDIAGRSLYCDETGGDYYDFITLGKPKEGRIALVVSDVSGHGISSALLMATARAFLRQRSTLPNSITEIISDVNRQISLDVEDSGQFMTLFLCEINTTERIIRWVSAGHDPAILYDLQTGSFDELSGRGVALGVFEEYAFEAYERPITPGQIILIGTDGIWESCNTSDEMFGKDRLKTIIRNSWSKPAREIVEAVIQGVKDFSRPKELEDDVTLVVVKFED